MGDFVIDIILSMLFVFSFICFIIAAGQYLFNIDLITIFSSYLKQKINDVFDESKTIIYKHDDPSYYITYNNGNAFLYSYTWDNDEDNYVPNRLVSLDDDSILTDEVVKNLSYIKINDIKIDIDTNDDTSLLLYINEYEDHIGDLEVNTEMSLIQVITICMNELESFMKIQHTRIERLNKYFNIERNLSISEKANELSELI